MLQRTELTNKYSYAPLRFSIRHTCTHRGTTPPLHTHTLKHKHICPPTHTQKHPDVCTHEHTHTHTRCPWNPWQISCCSYVKWIKLGSSKSSELARRDNSQTATCSKATNQLWVCVCVCVCHCARVYMKQFSFEHQMPKEMRSDLMCEPLRRVCSSSSV